MLHSAESRFLLSDGSRPQAARHARPTVSRGTLHLPSSVTVPMSLRVQMTSETSEPRNPRRGGGTWNLGMDSKKKSARRLWRARRTWNLQEPTAEGSRNQNRGTLHGVETSCTHWVHFVPFLRAHPVLARRARLDGARRQVVGACDVARHGFAVAAVELPLLLPCAAPRAPVREC